MGVGTVTCGYWADEDNILQFLIIYRILHRELRKIVLTVTAEERELAFVLTRSRQANATHAFSKYPEVVNRRILTTRPSLDRKRIKRW